MFKVGCHSRRDFASPIVTTVLRRVGRGIIKFVTRLFLGAGAVTRLLKHLHAIFPSSYDAQASHNYLQLTTKEEQENVYHLHW